MHKPVSRRPQLYIVNLQWTPKDDVALLKINGKCDDVLSVVMRYLDIDVPEYTCTTDPIFALATPMRENELKSCSKKMLIQPPSYDRAAVESLWRLSSKNRRTNRRTVAVLNELRCPAEEKQCIATANSSDDASLEISQRENFDENVTLAYHDDTSEISNTSGFEDCSVKYSSNNDLCSSFDYSSAELQSREINASRSLCDSEIEAALPNSVSVAHGVNDKGWWNNVDSHTWLQGLHSYLLLHSTVNTPQYNMPVAVLPPTAASLTLPLGARFSSPQTLTFKQHIQPVVTPCNGYKLSANGVLSPVPVLFVPITNCSTVSPVTGSFSGGHQQTYLGGQKSSLTAVDLVSFMHNYCIPPVRIPHSSGKPTTVLPANAFGQQMTATQMQCSFSSTEECRTVPITADNHQLPTASSRQTEISYSGNFLSTLGSLNPETASLVSSSSVCLTPNSLSSSSSAENWADDELNSSTSMVAINLNESVTSKLVGMKSNNLFSDDADDLTIPGWFGKGLGVKRLKRRLSKQS